jgi:hypothetical protein
MRLNKLPNANVVTNSKQGPNKSCLPNIPLKRLFQNYYSWTQSTKIKRSMKIMSSSGLRFSDLLKILKKGKKTLSFSKSKKLEKKFLKKRFF